MQREGQAHSPTKSEWDSADAKPAERSYGKYVGDFRGIVRFFLGGWTERKILKLI